MFEIVKNPYNDKKIRVSVLSNGSISNYYTTWKKFYRNLPFENIKVILHDKDWYSREFMPPLEWEYTARKYYDYFYLESLTITDWNGNVYSFQEYK